MRTLDTVCYAIPSYEQPDRGWDVWTEDEEVAVDIAEYLLYEKHGEDVLITDVSIRRRDTGRRDWLVTFDIEY